MSFVSRTHDFIGRYGTRVHLDEPERVRFALGTAALHGCGLFEAYHRHPRSQTLLQPVMQAFLLPPGHAMRLPSKVVGFVAQVAVDACLAGVVWCLSFYTAATTHRVPVFAIERRYHALKLNQMAILGLMFTGVFYACTGRNIALEWLDSDYCGRF